jgi:hypothetical protein
LVDSSILHVLLERVSTIESQQAEIKDLRDLLESSSLKSENEIYLLNLKVDQLQNDKEILEERVDILEALNVKSGKNLIYR